MQKSVVRSRLLRRSLSLPEGLLWREIRTLGNPVHLRRQFPIGGLTVDFACRELHLAFEIDGEAHRSPEEDDRRDAILRICGFEVIRIKAKEVLRDPQTIAEGIVGLCRERLAEKQQSRKE